MRMTSLSIHSPKEVTGGASSQAPDSLQATESRRALEDASGAVFRRA